MRVKYAIVVVMAVVWVAVGGGAIWGWGHLNRILTPDFFVHCPDEVSDDALERTYLRFPQYDNLSVWMSGTYEESYWAPRFVEEQAAIERIQVWARTLADTCVRKAYLAWMDFYQRDLDKARSELQHKTERQDMDAYRAQWAAKKLALAQYREKAPVVSPPLK